MNKMYLGKRLKSGKVCDTIQEMSSYDLTTHVFVCGSTGSGKTILGKILIEEAARNKIPSIIIDLKGDLSSLAIPVKKVNFFSFEKWIESRSGQSKNEILRKILFQYQKNFEDFDISASDLEDFRNGLDVKLYTPKSSITDTLSLSPLTSPPEHLAKLFKTEPEQVLKLINTNAKNLISKCFSTDKMDDYKIELVFLEESIKYLWSNKIQLVGREGILELIKIVKNPPFKSFAGLLLDEFISVEKRKELARQLNVLLLGSNLLWFKGKPIKKILEEIENCDPEKTPVIIFNLSFLDHFDEKNFVLTNIANEISIWMRKKVSSGDPKLVFYLDEIGAGSTSFYPAEPYSTSSKEAINVLLRQGRAFGICCILSTQNPGDIDYTGLTNCHTWFIGKLQTKEDRDKILQGIASFHIASGGLENFLKTTRTGDFAVKTKFGDIFEFKERWLMSYHKVMGERDFTILKNILNVERIMEKVNLFVKNDKIDEAEKLLTEKLEEGIYENSYILFELAKIQKIKKNYDVTLKILNKILAMEEGDYTIWKMKAELEIASEDFVSAEKSIDRLLLFVPYDLWAVSNLAYCSLKLDKFEKALGMAEKATKVDQKNSSLFHVVASCEKALGDFIKAVEAVNSAIDLEPEIPEYHLTKAAIYLNLEEIEIATDSYMRATELDPKCYDGFLGLAKICSQVENWNDAIENIQKAIKIDTERVEAFLQLGMIYYKKSDSDKAAEIFTKVVEMSPESHEAIYHSAVIYMEKKEFPKANEMLKRAIELDPDSAVYQMTRTNLLIVQGDFDEALNCANSALEADPDSENAHVLKAKIFVAQNDADGINSEIEKILQINPFNNFALLKNGETAEKDGNLQLALNSFKNIKSKDLSIWVKIGDLNVELEDYYSAIIAYDHLTDSVPENVDFWLKKAEIFIKMEKLDKALDCCDSVKNLDENNVKSWEIMMNVFTQMGEYNKAKYCQDKFEELGGEVKYEF
ncbi:DUF853 family protein [bacterium]|nr:DUF853 family protein [bacterium]